MQRRYFIFKGFLHNKRGAAHKNGRGGASSTNLCKQQPMGAHSLRTWPHMHTFARHWRVTKTCRVLWKGPAFHARAPAPPCRYKTGRLSCRADKLISRVEGAGAHLCLRVRVCQDGSGKAGEEEDDPAEEEAHRVR